MQSEPAKWCAACIQLCPPPPVLRPAERAGSSHSRAAFSPLAGGWGAELGSSGSGSGSDATGGGAPDALSFSNIASLDAKRGQAGVPWAQAAQGWQKHGGGGGGGCAAGDGFLPPAVSCWCSSSPNGQLDSATRVKLAQPCDSAVPLGGQRCGWQGLNRNGGCETVQRLGMA